MHSISAAIPGRVAADARDYPSASPRLARQSRPARRCARRPADLPEMIIRCDGERLESPLVKMTSSGMVIVGMPSLRVRQRQLMAEVRSSPLARGQTSRRADSSDWESSNTPASACRGHPPRPRRRPAQKRRSRRPCGKCAIEHWPDSRRGKHSRPERRVMAFP
jgi:hypothetical protein